MRTISQVVEEIIERSPFYTEVLVEGIANTAEMARKIRPEVEKRLLEEVSEASIGMALHRLSRKVLRRVPFGMGFLKRMHDITVRSNLVEYIFPNTADLSSVGPLVFNAAKHKKDAFVNFSRGLHESLLVLSTELEEEIAPVFKKHAFSRRITGLSAITIRLPEETLNIPGVYHPILKVLAWEGISFVEVMSVNTEFSIIFHDKDVDRAFSVINKLTS